MMYRFMLDLAIPEAVYDAIPQAKKDAFKDTIRAMKALAVRINEGQPNEEMTVKANWHLCLHDEIGNTIPCVEQEI